MTRKHYEAIAKAVRDTELSKDQKNIVARHLASEVYKFNVRFDTERFVAACLR